MRKWIILVLALLVAVLVGQRHSKGKDVSLLQPVETVRVASFNGYVTVETDTGTWGMGGDLQSALKNMDDTTDSYAFLETAEHLVIAQEQMDLLPSLAEVLRLSCSVCVEKGKADLKKVGTFLEIHQPEVTLKDCITGQKEIPTLMTTREGMELVW